MSKFRKSKLIIILFLISGQILFSLLANNNTKGAFNEPTNDPPSINNLGSPFYFTRQTLINNSIAYCNYWDFLLSIFDFSNPNDRIHLGNCSLEGGGFEGVMNFFDKYICYILPFNVSFYDISDPENPHINNTYPIDLGFRLVGLEICNNIGFVAGYRRIKINDYNFSFDGTLKILNLTDTTNTIIGEYYNEKLVQDIMIKDNLSVIVDNNIWDEYNNNKDYLNGFEIIDISNLTNPIRLSEWQGKCKPVRAKIIGNYLYLTTYDRGLLVFDINDPTIPILVNEYKKYTSFSGMFYDETWLYVTFDKGLYILDVTDPLNIEKIGKKRIYFEGNGEFGEVIVENDLAYASRSSEFYGREIFVFDVSDPNNPEKLFPLGIKIGFKTTNFLIMFSVFGGISIVIITVIVVSIVVVRKKRKKRMEESKAKIEEAIDRPTSQEEPIAESAAIK